MSSDQLNKDKPDGLREAVQIYRSVAGNEAQAEAEVARRIAEIEVEPDAG